jgi:hypothetical protein
MNGSTIHKRSQYFLLLLGLILIAGAPYFLTADPDRTELEKGIAAFKERMIIKGDKVLPDTTQVDQAISYFRNSLQQDSSKAAAGYYLLRAIYFKGVHASSDHDEQYNIFQQGRELGQELHDRHPDDARIMYWYAANLAKWAEVTGVVAAAKNGTASKLRDLAQQMIETDSLYQGGGGYRLLAQVHYYTPRIPLVLRWPSLDEAEQLAEKALETSDKHPANYYIYAQILEALDHHDKAHTYAQKVIALPLREGYEVEDNHLNELAEELIEHKIPLPKQAGKKSSGKSNHEDK